LARRHRLAAESRTADAVTITDALVALHASDPATVHLSAAARMPLPAVGPVSVALYDDRTLLRHHGMRRTLWVASVEVVRLIHASSTAALAPREWARLAAWAAASGIEDAGAWVERTRARTLEALRELGPTTARRLGRAVPELTTKIVMGTGKWVTEQAVHTRMLLNLGFDAAAVRTAPSGSWITSEFSWAAMDQWLPGGLHAGDPHPARREVIRRYLGAFGPATTADLQWWAGWTATAVRSALRELEAVEVTLDGGLSAWVLPDDLSADEASAPWVALLPGLDPTAMGWKDRSWCFGELGGFGGPLFDRNGNAGPTVWVDGEVVGGWAQRRSGEIVISLLRPVKRSAQRALDLRAAELQAAIGDQRVVPRFPSPLHRDLVAPS